ncbi:hypothetical protein JAAARDRAFT_184813 [Jaapia argillacea MUCL 33604]|uniref:Protein kinase domain-containing protein n=1 Tax=Jaapia argillacea MUCL 33604 TaxID=933084 RepID=A0A067PD58_9AGAM|nr:hypothetical protein JAAARDRAFT_184813 [Jaapia argillacea MUCL 33604]
MVWRQLDHPNVLQFIGVDSKTFDLPSLVMPWMQNGNLFDYVSNIIHPACHHLMELGHGVLKGLSYLHSNHVVHGDLRCANVLLNDMGQPCLADFGLAVFVEETHDRGSNDLAEGGFNDHAAGSQSTYAGSLRWLAPEALVSDSPYYEWRRRPSRDIYAFGSLCLEIFTGFEPYYPDIQQDAALPLWIFQHKRPPRPVFHQSWGGLVDLYLRGERGFVERCWDENPASRPTCEDLLKSMEEYFNVGWSTSL